MGVGSAVNFLIAWVLTFTAPYFINPWALNWGAKCGSLEELDELFEAKAPARKFKS